MKTSTKVLVGVGVLAAIGGGVYYWSRKRGAPVKGTAYLGEFHVSGCDCYQTDYFEDGTSKSTKVDRSNCADDFASPSLAHCPQTGGAAITEKLASAWASMFPGAA